MSYILIKGSFHVVGYSPDGDSLMFRANNGSHWDKIITDYRDIFETRLEQKGGAVQLRLQGVDALETHYSASSLSTPQDLKHLERDEIQKPKAIQFHQPSTFGDRATETLLYYFNVVRLEWKSSWGGKWIDRAWIKKGSREFLVEDRHADEIPGYIITNDIERKGRPISWVFAGKTRTRDGSNITKSSLTRRLPKSGNYHLLKMGMVYPYFFMTLAASLREKLIEAVDYAQENAKEYKNLWAIDRTERYVTLKKMETITTKYNIYPYLFRKIVKHQYLQRMKAYWNALEHADSFKDDDEAVSLENFLEGGNPYVFLVKEKDFVKLEEILYLSKTRIKLKTSPQNIVFLG